MRHSDLFDFIKERHAIYTRRQQGIKKPWTYDHILQNYRFCNVYRELDTVTQWIAKNWRDPNTNDNNVWFAMAVARLVNWPDTMEALGYPVPWNPKHFITTLAGLKMAGAKVFTGAYMIPADARYTSKAESIATAVLTPMWEKRNYIYEATDCLAHFHHRLMKFNGMGSFLAGQVVCDAKYTTLLRDASDWETWACSGPGSRRGLNRVAGRPVNAPWKESDWFKTLTELKQVIDILVVDANMPAIHAQDLQNCLCEFDKYERVRLGEGKPRSRYPGKP
jgi:hypothetical protein